MTNLYTTDVVSKFPQIHQLSYGGERANTYILNTEGHALVIDACSESVSEELKRRRIIPDYLILTHEHCDHIWGVNVIRSAFPNIQVVAQEYCSEAIGNPNLNKAKQYHIYATLRFGEGYRSEEAMQRTYSCAPAEIVFEEELSLTWHGYGIGFHHAPGHSPGSMIINFKGIGVFSGDSILQEETFMNFDGGDESAFNSITLPMITRIPGETNVYPGHGGMFQMREWKSNR